jgi:NADP-dependent 3-hydroxy acid dehydrogenase YdfG
MSLSIQGKTALITGASAGIGRATALKLGQAGAHVIALGRRVDALDALKQALPAGAVTTLAGDLNDAGFLREVGAASSQVDIFVNNAGVLRYAPLMELSDDDVDWMFQTNVLAALKVTRAVARPMMERGSGHLVFMTSIAAREVFRLASVYCATKHALSALARAFRLELQGHGIKVTEIAPGMVDTEIRAGSTHPAVAASVAARKFKALTAEEVAESVLYAVEANPNLCPDLIELRPQGSV